MPCLRCARTGKGPRAFLLFERVKGDHHIFTMTGMEEILNLRPKGAKAKAYQVKHARNLVFGYGLTLGG